MIGALLLNVLLPNATRQLVNQVEAQIHRATGLSFDFNGDNTNGANAGSAAGNAYVNGQNSDKTAGDQKGNVEGFDNQ